MMAANMQSLQDLEFQLRCQLISEVQQTLILFNKGHPMHFMRGARNEEYASIGVMCHFGHTKPTPNGEARSRSRFNNNYLVPSRQCHQ